MPLVLGARAAAAVLCQGSTVDCQFSARRSIAPKPENRGQGTAPGARPQTTIPPVGENFGLGFVVWQVLGCGLEAGHLVFYRRGGVDATLGTVRVVGVPCRPSDCVA